MEGNLRLSCQAARARIASIASAQRAPATAKTTLAANAISQETAMASRPPVNDLNEIAFQLQDAIRSGQSLDPRRIRNAIWCLWETTPMLASDALVLKTVLDAVLQSTRRQAFRNLATLYLVQYRSDRPGLREISEALKPLALDWGNPWADQQQNFQLFDYIEGPRNIARKALRDNMSPTEAMKAIGLSVLSAQSDFAAEVTKSLLLQLAEGGEPNHEERLKKVQAYAFNARNEILFRNLEVEVADALLRPFLGKPPEKRIKDIFLNFVISIFGDPRLAPVRWERFPKLKSLVIGWLTEQSLRQFLDVVSKTVTDPDERVMWKYRRAFWEAAYNKGIVHGAWVVFAEEGATLARRSFGDKTGFGTFNDRGSKQVQRSHAVLLLEIGQSVVADWSHNGKCNIWSDGSLQDAPKLYRRSYSSDDVRIVGGNGNIKTSDRLSWTHASPRTYSWQREVAERIYNISNTRLHERDYRVV